MARFKEALLKERDDLRARIQNLKTGEDVDGSVQDSIDAASDLSMRDLVRGLTATEAERLRQIDRALEKIGAGTYGTCEACGKPIEAERLEAIPFAATCVTCKRQEEQRRSARR